MKTRRKKITFKITVVVFTYLLIELICFASMRLGIIPAKEPTFHFVRKNPQYPAPMADINEIWGTWHYKEKFEAHNGCVYFDYSINSYGARDRERTIKSADSNRVVVLGDSFLEGWGIEEDRRISNLLESKTGRQFLNFGCADFGTTQEYLVYKHLATNFDHSTVLIGFLPFNDFENDDKTFWETQDRYRPFYMKSDSGYHLTYYKPSLKDSELNKGFYKSSSNSFKATLGRFLRAYTYWFNIVDYIKNAKHQKNFFKFKDKQIVSYYYDYTPEQLEKFKFILTQIREAAPGKKIILCSIPVIPDIMRRQSGGEPPLPAALTTICQQLQISYIDLLPSFAKKDDYRNYYFFCDSHWNEKANAYSAELLLPFFK